MKTKKPKGPTKAALQRKILELEASMASRCYFASKELEKAGADLIGSGAVLQLTALGGKEIIPPVLIRDGLSLASIAALADDIQRSFDRATEFKPAT